MRNFVIKFKSNDILQNHLTFSQNVILITMFIMTFVVGLCAIIMIGINACLMVFVLGMILAFIFGVYSEYQNKKRVDKNV